MALAIELWAVGHYMSALIDIGHFPHHDNGPRGIEMQRPAATMDASGVSGNESSDHDESNNP